MSDAATRTSLAERLGFAADDRVAVVHCDDIGMCHAANDGAFEALENGPASCGSIMVPCPWFEGAAAHARANPSLDLGVHLTLNAEWPHYRWGPVAGRQAVPSLCAPDGGLWRTVEEVAVHAKPDEVAVELRAQVEKALDAGIDVTHIDAHMGTAFLPPFLPIYAELAREFRLAAFVVRPHRAQLGDGAQAAGMTEILKTVDRMEADGIPSLDGFDADSLAFAEGEGAAHNAGRLDGLRPGVSYLICHPARQGPELSAISADAHARDFERQYYGGDAGRAALDSRDIKTLGMRALRDFVRRQEP
ncbi:MAG: polysaccharide deacetylase family protein [Myxococcota bacterium]